MLSHAIGSPDNCVSVKVWKTRWTWKDVGCRLEKIKAWCCKLHWLQGAVTWQQGDQISKFVRACVLQFACLLVHMLLCGHFKAPFEDTIHFLCDKASQTNRCTHLRPDKWSHNCLRYSSVTFHAPTFSLFSLHSVSAGRVSLVRITTLRLEGLLLADQGLYECRILSLDKPTDELQNGTWTVLSVTGEVNGTACVCHHGCSQRRI